MSKTAMIRARIEPELKDDVEYVFEMLGLNATEVITMLYKQIKLRQGIPFDIKIPNVVTREAIKDAGTGKGKSFDSLGKLFEDLKS
ncbi:MAG: type II toxin-antitoxin system RelB/DinJ family antitoxin [Candidatus Anammoxibacter sp.]